MTTFVVGSTYVIMAVLIFTKRSYECNTQYWHEVSITFNQNFGIGTLVDTGICENNKLLILMYILCSLQHLQIRNTLDLMHCKKNYAENVMKTICGAKEKGSLLVR